MKRVALVLPPLRRLVQQRDALLVERARLRARVRRLQSQVAHAPPEAGQAGRDLRYLFVLTYGRSGSTLLQGVLNSIPGYLIRGENNGVLHKYYDAHLKLAAKRDDVGLAVARKQERDAWFGIDGYDDGVAFAAIRSLMLQTLIRPDPDSRTVGYKEIRYHQTLLSDYVGFIRSVFPGARFIVNTRNLDEVAQSGWWADDPDALERLTETEARLLAVADQLGSDAFRVRYDDYREDPAALAGLFDWLGEAFDERSIAAIMSRRHSF